MKSHTHLWCALMSAALLVGCQDLSVQTGPTGDSGDGPKLGDSRSRPASPGAASFAPQTPGPAIQAAGDLIAYSVRSDVDQNLYEVNLTTGTATAIGPTGFGDVEALAFDPDATVLYGYDDITEQLLTCDIGTGACTAVGPSGLNVVDMGISFDDHGDIYMVNDVPRELYRLDPGTGVGTDIGPLGQAVTGLAWSSTEGKLFGLGGDFNNNLVTVDRTTGAATSVGALGAVSLVDGGISFDRDGRLWGLEDGGDVFTIDVATGAATVQFNIGSGFESLAIPAPFVRRVDIDIKPGSDPNSINLKSKGVIPVAVLTTADFDATTVDAATVTFEGASPAHGGHLEDVDGDGDLDWLGHFRTQDAVGLTEASTSGTLMGQTTGGVKFQGSDAVRIVPGSSKGK